MVDMERRRRINKVTFSILGAIIVLVTAVSCLGGTGDTKPADTPAAAAAPTIAATGPAKRSEAEALREKRLAVSTKRFVPEFRSTYPTLAGEGRKTKYLAKIGAYICGDFDDDPTRTLKSDMSSAKAHITHDVEPTNTETKEIIALSVKTVCPEHAKRLG